MSDSTPSQFSVLLDQARKGSAEAKEELILLVYQDLRRLAQTYLNGERPSPSLQATALVHEVYLRLFSDDRIDWQGRSHFLIVAARQMRRILIDRARTAGTVKRNGQRQSLPIENALLLPSVTNDDLIKLDDALQSLEKLRRRTCQIVELRFFVGLTVEEIAQVLDISVTTVKREWNYAKAWLYDQIRDDFSA